MTEDSEHRSAILAAARAALAASGKFTLRGICADTGLARGVVTRCFGGKDGLVAALLAEDVRDLSGVIAAAPEQPAMLASAVGENIVYIDSAAVATPSREPLIARRGEVGRLLEERQIRNTETALKAETEAGRAPDAWLERRLRVFERALNNIELRDEKSDRDRTASLGAMEESLRQMRDELAQAEARRKAEALDLRAELNDMTMRIGTLELARLSPQANPEPFITHTVPEIQDAEFVETERDEPAAAAPVSEEPVVAESFLAQARRSAQAAQNALEEEEPPKDNRLRNRVLIVAAAAAILLLVSATFAFGKFSRDSAATGLMVNGVTHRHPALSGAARLRMLADGGDADARTMMALDYLRGDGVPQSDAAAARWTLLAAGQGQPVAQYILGTLYRQGTGVTPDAHAAFRWFEASARQGNRKAMHDLAIAYAQGVGVDKNPQEAARWFSGAAQLGYVDSQFDLAVLYERGEGVPQSLTEAFKWYSIAATQGDGPSAARAAALRTQLPPDAVDAAERAAKAFAPGQYDASANSVAGNI